MKAKNQRAGSFLCFGAPVTAEESAMMKNEKEEVDKKEHRRSMSNLVKSISFKSSKSPKKIAKEQCRSLSRKISDSSEAQYSTRELFGKKSDAAIFSSSSLSSSSNSSCSSSSSSSCLSRAAIAAIAPESKLHRRRTFVPPPAPRNNGYAIGLFLVLLSLLVVVICGRLCAILWIATWLCLVPRRRMGWRPPESEAAPESEIRRKRDCREEEEEEKKRVVMEGFLQRNRKTLDKNK